MTSSVLAEPPVDAPELVTPLDELVTLWRRVDQLPSLPDATQVSGDVALRIAAAVAQVRAAADALLAPYAARVEELSQPGSVTRFARWKGFPSAAALLSSVTGLSVGEASKLVGLGQVLAQADAAVVEPARECEPDAVVEPPTVAALEPEAMSVPETVPMPEAMPMPEATPAPSPLAAAIRAGWLGTEMATIIRRTLGDMCIETADTERYLVDAARDLSITKLRRLCLETLAERDPEGHAAREARQHKARFLHFFEEPDGMVGVFGKLPPSHAAWLKGWVEAELQTETFAQRDLHPTAQRSGGQIAADVFVEMARHAVGCTSATTRPKSTIVIHASRESIESGVGFARCDGIEAPITMATVMGMAVDAEFRALLTDSYGVALNAGRTRRIASVPQREAAMNRDKGCAKCSRAISRCDAHHIIWWSRGGKTNYRNLVMLCVRCHHEIHDNGWGIDIVNNEVWFIPPASIDPQRRRQPGSSVRPAHRRHPGSQGAARHGRIR